MKQPWQRLKDLSLLLIIFISSTSIFADLPKPPDKDLANSSNDWGDVGGHLIFKIMGYSAYGLGALILLAVAAGMIKAYQTAHEKQELGHFFKMLIVGLICAALGIALVYGGYSILPAQN